MTTERATLVIRSAWVRQTDAPYTIVLHWIGTYISNQSQDHNDPELHFTRNIRVV